MTCPTCGSDCYDNTAKVAGGWKGPLAKCKNPECVFEIDVAIRTQVIQKLEASPIETLTREIAPAMTC